MSKNSAYNRLAFDGYFVFIKTLTSTTLWRHSFPTADTVYRAIGHNESFPSPSDFAMYIANSERKLGTMCMPAFVEDNNGEKIWSNDAYVDRS